MRYQLSDVLGVNFTETATRDQVTLNGVFDIPMGKTKFSILYKVGVTSDRAFFKIEDGYGKHIGIDDAGQLVARIEPHKQADEIVDSFAAIHELNYRRLFGSYRRTPILRPPLPTLWWV